MLKHQPETPCRASVYGEGIYLGAWQRFMATTPEYCDGEPDDRFLTIYGPRLQVDFDTVDDFEDEAANAERHKPRQRAAAVAASFIVWLGTNCGQSFVHEARKLSKELSGWHRERAYLYAWTYTNSRHAGMNGMRITAQAIVKEPDATDLEVMTVTAEWLATADGQNLIAEAEKEIDLTRAALREQNQMVARAQTRARDMKEAGLVVF